MMGLYLKIAGFALALTFFAINDLVAQKYFKASIDSAPNSIIRKLTTESQITGMEEGKRSVERILVTLYDYGYLAASADTFFISNDTLFAEIYSGVAYSWMHLKNGNLDEGLLTETGFREKFYDNKPVSVKGINDLNKRILEYCENHGYPFASLVYDNFEFDGAMVTASLFLQSERLVTIDSVIVKGSSRLSQKYLTNYLSMKPGDIYNESLVKKVGSRVRELPMVTEVRPFSVVFVEDKARLILALDDKKASQIDGVIGVLPDNSGSGKIQITGDLRIRLLSSFGRGELFDLNWKQPQAKTQDLKVRTNYPFIFSSQFGLDFNLGIYKKDTSYLEVTLGGGVQFLLKGGNYLKAFVSDKKSNLLSTKAFENTTVLPSFADVRITSYGIGFKSANLDYRFNPRKGYSLEVTASAGNKTIEKNSKLNQSVYDSLELKSVQYNGELIFDYYIPFFKRNVVNIGVMGAALSGENTFDNELYRFGGLRTLRGFDEESLTASLYTVGKVEIRYLLEQNSYLFVFLNQGWYERNSGSAYTQDDPIGFGAGITFETKLGIFSFNYALGKEFDNPIRFKTAKVHFGLINYF
jgi:outer membrane protein assembly factor BamA